MSLSDLPVELFMQVIEGYVTVSAYKHVWRARGVSRVFRDAITTEVLKQLPVGSVNSIPRKRKTRKLHGGITGPPGVPDAYFVRFLTCKVKLSRSPRGPVHPLLDFIDDIVEETMRVGALPDSARDGAVTNVIKCLVYDRPSSKFEWAARSTMYSGEYILLDHCLAAAAAVGSREATDFFLSIGTSELLGNQEYGPILGNAIQNASVCGHAALLDHLLQLAYNSESTDEQCLQNVILESILSAIKAQQTSVIKILIDFFEAHWPASTRQILCESDNWLRAVPLSGSGSVETAKVVVPIALANGGHVAAIADSACEYNCSEIIRYLIDAGKITPQTATHSLAYAVRYGSRTVADLLLACGADIHRFKLMGIAVNRCNLDMTKHLLSLGLKLSGRHLFAISYDVVRFRRLSGRYDKNTRCTDFQYLLAKIGLEIGVEYTDKDLQMVETAVSFYELKKHGKSFMDGMSAF